MAKVRNGRSKHSPLGAGASSHLIALEPRMMFDGAAVATAADAAATVHEQSLAPEMLAAKEARADAHDIMWLDTEFTRYHMAPERFAARDQGLIDNLGLGVQFGEGSSVKHGGAVDATTVVRNDVIFIDTNVAAYDVLVAEWADKGTVVLIDGSADGIDQMRLALAGQSNIGAIHIVSHGVEGAFFLGTTRVDTDAINGSLSSSFAAIGRSLSLNGDILIYGCDVGAGTAGQALIDDLARVTQADVAASVDDTGATIRNANWTLERTYGLVDTDALYSLTYQGVLAPLVLSAPANSLTVKDAAGNNIGFVGGATVGLVTGAVARWTNVGTAGGGAVDLIATVTEVSAGDTLRFFQPGTNNIGTDDFGFQILTPGTTGTAFAKVVWTVVKTGTTTAVVGDVSFTIADLDGVSGATLSREWVDVSTDTLSSYQSAATTNVRFINSPGLITASGTEDQTQNPPTAISAAKFNWLNTSGFGATYNLARASLVGGATFSHDGDQDFNLGTGGVTVSIPRLDLDANDSTAAGTSALKTYIENGSALSVTDSDVLVTNPAGTVTGGTITLTNRQTGDVLSVGSLPVGVSATIDTSVATKITVTLTGSASAAAYQAAFAAVLFSSTSERPSTVDRNVTATFTNGTLNSNLAASTIKVIEVNDPPVAVNDTASTNEDTAVIISVLANDTDADGDVLTVTAATAPNGTVVRNANGTITYTPNANFNGTDTITYTISDGRGGTSTATVTVTIAAVNDAPTPVGSLPAQVNLDAAAVSVATAGGFTDVDNATLTYSATGLPAGLTINTTTGVISGTIDRSASQVGGGNYNIVVTATDAGGLSATQKFAWTVTNPAPTVNNDTASTNEDTTVNNINVLGNDSDPDGDPLTATTASAVNGTVTINANGTLNYTPNKDFNGTDTITYTISDGQGGTSTAKVTVTVAAVNDPPVPVGTLPAQVNVDAAAVSVATVAGFTDIDNATLTYSATGLPVGLSINATTGVISGTIDRSASQVAGGVYNIVVTATDAGGLSAAQKFSWTVTNPGPVAKDDTASTLEDTAVTVAVLANDSDPDGDPLTVTTASATNGTVAINANGTITYTPKANFNGTDTITYTISDGQGGTSTAKVVVTVPAVNDPPAPVGTLPAQTNLDAATGISVATAGGFTDVDNPTLTYSATGLPAGLSINTTTGVISGTIDRSASQTGGGIYTVVVTATDAGGLSAAQKFAWTVTNPGPTAANDTATTAEDTAIASIDVLGNDSDPDGDPLKVVSASAANGTVTINGDGTLRYVPNANFNGTDTITYQISDGQGGFAKAIVTVTVTPVNDAPTATTIPPRANADAAVVSVPVSSFFSDVDGDTLTYSATGLPTGLSINATTGVISGTIDRSASQAAGGIYTVNITASDSKGGTVTSSFTWTVTNPGPVAANDSASTNEDTAVAIPVLANDSDPDGDPLTVTSATAANGTVTIGAGGVLTYTPNANFNGTDTIKYQISDGQGGTATATVTVTVNAVNDVPVAKPLPGQTNLDGQIISLPVAGAFSDPDGDVLSFAATGLPAGLTINAATGVISGAINRSASQVNGGVYTVTVTASDGKGGTVTSTFTWNVSNPAPVAVNDMASGNEDTALRIDVLANDRDPDGDPLRVTSASAGHGTVTINPDGSLNYVPDANYNGSDTIIYSITDSEGGKSTATVSVSVRPINDAPTTTGLGDQSDPDVSTVSVPTASAFNDIDGDVLGFAAKGLPPGLTIDPNTGLITGTLTPGSSTGGPNGDGSYSVTVFATDPSGVMVSATFVWRVQNIPPIANDDFTITNEDTAVTYAVLQNDTDKDLDPLRVTGAIATHGTVVVNGDNTVTFTPDPDFNGVATVTYNITDSRGGVATATLTITIAAVNDRPDSVAMPNETNQDNQAVSVGAASFFSDRDGDVLKFTATGLPAGLSIDAAGKITGTIDKNASQPGGGVYSVTITATDPGGLATSQTFTWTITNPAPTAINDTATTNEDTAVTIAPLANDTDPDGDPLKITAATAPNGTVVINVNGTITYTPKADFNGTDTITYTISDGNGGFSTAAVIVTVTSVNDAPVAANDVARTNEDTPVRVTVLANDTDPDGDPLTVTAASAPNGTVTINPDGTITYTPRANFNGTDTITYTISDGKGGTSTATVTVTVDPVNDPPVANNDIATTNEDTPVTVSVLANDTDIDGDPLTVVSATAANGTVVINPNGTITYTPNKDYNGTDTITYQISDGKGGFSTATVTVTVVPVNDAPVANPPLAPQANPDGATVSVATAATFSDPDGDVLTYSAVGLPAGLTINTTTGIISGTIDRSASQLNGGIYSATVTASDGKGGTVTSTFGWTITNPAPTASNDTATTNEDTAVTIAVLTNDTDPDGDPLTVVSATAPNGMVVINPNGTITYTPALNFNGTDTITYEISDGQGGTSTATVTVTVNAVNDAPTVVSPIPPQKGVDAGSVSVPVAGNFTDLDGDTLSFTAAGLPMGLSINPATGLITGTIDRSASQVAGGVYAVSVTASDGKDGTVTTTFTWTVTNPGPTAVDDIATTNEDTAVTISVLTNDTDPDGDPLTVTTATAPNGTVVINANGTITYTPKANFNGTDVITYTISDGQGGTSTATVTVTVVAQNDAPTVVSPIPAQKGVDAGAVSVPVAGNFTDLDGDTLTFAASGLPLGLSVNPATGLITGTIDRSASQVTGGVYSVSITASDGNGGSVTTTFMWTVTNPGPTAVDDVATTNEDTAVIIPVLTNDTDPDGDPLSVISATAPNGTVIINANGTITYTPKANFNGTDIITYTISDGQGGTSTAIVTVTVVAVNDAPTVVTPIADRSNLDGAAVSVPTAANFTDLDGDTLSFAANGLPVGLTINAATGVISGTIDKGASQPAGGVYTVTVTASDGKGGTVSTTFTWTVTNPGPTAVNDTASTNEDTAVTISVLANDTDPDGDTLSVVSAAAGNGTVVINANGTITYTPKANFFGTDTITYVISDGNGGTSTATVTVTMTPVNDAPVVTTALPNLYDTQSEFVSVSTGLAFKDVDGDTLSYAISGLAGTGLTYDPVTGVISGQIAADAAGPTGQKIYTITVTASDGKGGTISTMFDWTITNRAPTAIDDSFITNEDTPITMNVLVNDNDPDANPLTPIVVIDAIAQNGAATINADGTITFVPDLNFNGETTVTYRISDGQGGFSTATVRIIVNPINDQPTGPTLPNQSGTDAQGGVSIPLGGLFSDVDGDTLSFTATGLPTGLSINAITGLISGTIDRSASQTNGGVYAVTVTVSDGKGGTVDKTFLYTVTNPGPAAANDVATTAEEAPVTVAILANDSDPDADPLTVISANAANGTVVINADGTITYTPALNFNGTDTIIYTISDGQGGTATATVTVTVTAVNDAPVASPLTPQNDVDAAVVSVPTAANFSDVDGDTLTYAATGLPTGLSINATTGLISGTIDKNASQPNGGVYTVTVTASDGKGGIVSSTFVWTVMNPGPVAINDTASTNEDTAVTITVLTNDSDPDGDTLKVSNARSANGTVVINPDGTLTYKPNPNFNGTDTITYTISDGNGGTAQATVTVTVAPVNDAPTVVAPLPAQNDADGSVVSIPTAGNFTDLDGDTLTFTATGLPAGLSINAAGLISGTIDRNASQPNGGVYTVTVTASDGKGGTISTTFTYTVTNPGPVAVNDTASTNEDTAVTVSVLANDTDPDGDPVTVTTASAANGTVLVNPDGTITYKPNNDFNGTDVITYTISDGNGGTSQATVAVTVAPINDPPVAKPDTATTNEEAPVTVAVLSNDTDLDGNPLTVTAATAPNGTVVINPDGTITYTPNANFNGTDTITYTISDGAGGFATSTVTVVVAPVNDAPVASNDTATTNEDTPLKVSPLLNDTDVDGDPLTITAASSPNGKATVNPDGTITYVPNPNFNGTDVITYTISDGKGGTSTATITVTVAAVNDPPVAVNDIATTNEDTPVTVPVLANDTDLDGNPLTVTAATAANGTVVINPDGTVTYTPKANFFGVDTITYTISDGQGGSSTATVTVTVASVNDVPVATNDTATTNEDAAVTIPVLANDTDADGDPLVVTAASAPNGTVVINPDGTVAYKPNPNFNGTDMITYTISDGRGGTTTATVTVTVAPVNDPPAAVADVAATNEDTPLVIAPLFNDSDLDGNPLTITSANAPNGTVVINPDGTITYIPNANFNGTDTITYTISDGAGGFSTATITVSVAPVNDPPVAVPDAATTNEETPAIVNVLSNDRDVEGDPLTVTAASAPNGTVTINPDGTLRYVPNANFFGNDTITYTISDGRGDFATSTVTMTVINTNDLPIAVNDVATTLEDTPVSLNVLANDSDPDGNPLTVVRATAPNGTVVIGRDGLITYTPALNFNGTDVITYTITDGTGALVTATVTVTVTPVNDAPTDGNETVTVIGGVPINIPVLANAADVDRDTLTVVSAVPSIGTVVINPDGTITYTAPPEFDGVATITYVVSDGKGGTVTSTVTVNVTQANADIGALLRIGEVNFPDPAKIKALRPEMNQFINTPLIILDTANGFRSLNGTTDLNVQSPLLAAVNAIRPLNGTVTLDVDGSPVMQVVDQIEQILDFRFGMEKLFDPRFGDFKVEGLTGFSVRPQGITDKQVMIESVVRDRVIYMEVRDVGTGDDPMIIEHQIRMRDGRPLPDWIHFDKRGLAIIERPADVDEIHLIVRSIRSDGKVIETPVVIQGATGEIQLDQPLKTSAAVPFDRTVQLAHAAAQSETDKLAAAFNS